MKDYSKSVKDGYALIIAIGVLSILIIIVLSYSLMVKFEASMADNFNSGVTAKFIAEAGTYKAIAQLKNKAENSAIWSSQDGWYSGYQDNSLLDGNGEYNVVITDCSAQVNINDTANSNLARILAELPSITYSEAQDIITYRNSLSDGKFTTKEQIRQVSGLIDSGESYDDFKDYITAHSYVDGSLNRSPVNINTAPKEVLIAVFKWVLSGSQAKADSLADEIILKRTSDAFDSWGEFDTFIDTAPVNPPLTADEKTYLKDNANPEKDKSALLNQTTEFCFFAGGWFEINSNGKSLDVAGLISGDKNAQSIVKVFDVAYQTSKEDFKQGECWKVTYWDNCPVDSSQDGAGHGWDNGSENYTCIPDSLKIGFWEDFDEEYPVESRLYWDARGSNSYVINDGSSNSPGNELYLFMGYGPMVDLGKTDGSETEWQWPDSSFRCWVEEYRTGGPDWHVAYILCKVQPFTDNDYILGEKDPVWTPNDVAGYELPSTHPQIDHASQLYQIDKTHKMVVSDGIANFYDNNMVWALRPWSGGTGNYSVDVDYYAGTFGAWGWAELPNSTLLRIDNVRIIPRSPDRNDNYAHNDSIIYGTEYSEITPGAIYANINIPQSANYESEKIYLQTKVASQDWLPAKPGLLTPGGKTASSIGNGIQFRVNFQTLDDRTSGLGLAPYFSETPVLEDVTLIYMPETQMVYHRED